MDDLSTEISLTCPTCGCTKFESEQPKENEDYTDDWPFTCARCGRTFTRKELIEAHNEHIDAAIDNMKDEIVEAAVKELKKAFKG
ncbi:hypothetical protein [Cryptobacterium curtum]|uniref:ECs_2282 family putative zinc-binding protein n=1 Tax=Cryptobacterium curtum TaxID=84163 RepID=UPI0028D3CF76|nr:hypothetical protein [Cryptobacterium curtum]